MALKLYEENDIRGIAEAIRIQNGSSETYKVSEMRAAVLALNVQAIPADLVEYPQWNTAVKNFIENVVYDPSDYSVSLINNYVNFSNKDASAYPLGYAVSGEIDGRAISVEENDTIILSDNVSGNNYTIYNLIPGEEYLYTVYNGKSSIKAGYIKPLGQVRQIRTPSVWNMRDLGGWSGAAGTVKYGLIYRSGSFDSISDADKALLRDVLKIKEEIDLRSAADAGSVSKLGSDIAFLDAPLIGYTDDFTSRVAQLKQIFTDIFARASKGEAVDFHCSAGCDRTETIAYIILSLLGVSQSDIDKDYELTTMTHSNTQAHRTTSSYASMVTSYIAGLSGSTLEEKMVRYFIGTLGFTTELINGFRANMLTDAPPKYFRVTGNYTDVTNSNSADLITSANYSATLTADNGAEMTVSVKMGGTDITSTAYSDGHISIPNVTGDIVINAIAQAQTSYTNILNSVGYYDNNYLSGANGMKAGTGDVTTGFIDISGYVDGTWTMYVKGYTAAASASHTRIRAQATTENTEQKSEVNGFLATPPSWLTVTNLGTGYYKLDFKKINSYISGVKYLRMSFASTLGKNLIITIDEPIE